MADDVEVIWVKSEPKYFCKGGWTGVSVICPPDKINRPAGLLLRATLIKCTVTAIPVSHLWGAVQ
jgi:hypothetical protein